MYDVSCTFLVSFLIYFIDYAITVAPFSHLYSLMPCTPPPTRIPPSLSSCPWVVHINSLASTFPILYLTYPCLFSICNLCYLFPVPFPPFSHFPTDNPPCDLHFCDSVPVLVVCLVCFCFCFMFSCQFVVILLFIVLIFFFLH